MSPSIHADDYLAPGMLILEVPESFSSLAEWVDGVDNGSDLPGFEELPYLDQVLLMLHQRKDNHYSGLRSQESVACCSQPG